MSRNVQTTLAIRPWFPLQDFGIFVAKNRTIIRVRSESSCCVDICTTSNYTSDLKSREEIRRSRVSREFANGRDAGNEVAWKRGQRLHRLGLFLSAILDLLGKGL